jgi:hypothetical protein
LLNIDIQKQNNSMQIVKLVIIDPLFEQVDQWLNEEVFL